MSRPTPRKRFDRYVEGDICERRKPCSGKLELFREFGPRAGFIKWRIFRCDSCGKKHLTRTKREVAA